MNNNNSDARSQVTRQDRAVTDDSWIIALLHRAPMAALATAQAEQPFLSTLLLALDETRRVIYFHTAKHGRVWDNLQTNPRVCLTVSEMGRLLPASTALNFSVEYQSVVVFGPARLVDDPAEAELGLQMILDKYFPHLHPGPDYRPMTNEELNATAVFRMEIETWSGKRKAVGDNFPGAYHWGDTH